MVQLKDKVVIVTGASKGIGLEAALLFAKEGSRVVLVARRDEPLKKAIKRLEGGADRHLSIAADISKETDMESLVCEVIKKYGRIDVLVNNAAISYVGRASEMDPKQIDDVLNVNLLGTIKVTRQVLPVMIRQKSGHIINISSVLGKRGVSYRSLYSASKFGLEGFMESLRPEVAKYNIKISMVRPSSVNTDFSKKISQDSRIAHHKLGSFRADTIGKVIVDIAKRPKREINIGIPAKGFVFFSGLFPKLFDIIVRDRQKRRVRCRITQVWTRKYIMKQRNLTARG